MADGPESIGQIQVEIGADYGPLVTAYSTAESLSEQKGKDIADALAAGGAAGANLAEQLSQQLGAVGTAADAAVQQLDLFGAAIEQVPFAETSGQLNLFATELETIQGSAAGAAGDVGTFTDSTDTAAAAVKAFADAEEPAVTNTEHVGEAANEAQQKLAEMAEKLTQLAEALVVTEGLREFGQEAAAASDNVTRAAISLEKLRGDAAEAQGTIADLEELGMSEGLAFPSLLTAATRMTALLPEGTNVAALLTKIGDGAAVMGADIGSAADKFDRMVSAGTANVRTLTSLGISMSGLAESINKVTGAEDATAASASKAFKELDQADRIKVLETALDKMGGTAARVANETFGGEWTRLANSWDAVMVQAGDAIKPLVAELAEFLALDVIPFLKELGQDFNALPAPVKDAAVALALVTASLAPLLAGMAGISLAVSGLQGILPALTGVLETFGITASAVAIEEDAATASTQALGAAAVTTEGELAGVGVAASGLASVLAGSLAAALIAGAALWADYRTRAAAAGEQYKNIVPEFDKWIAAQVSGAKTGEQLAAAEEKVRDSLAANVITTQQATAMTLQLEAAYKSLLATDVKSMLDGMGVSLHIVADDTTKATDTLSLLKTVLGQTEAEYGKVSAAYQVGAKSAADLLAATRALESAQKSYDDELAKHTLDPYVDGLKALATQEEINAAQEDVLANKFTLLSSAASQAAQKLVDLNKESQALKAAVDAGTGSEQAYLDKLKEVAAAADDYTKKEGDLNEAKLKAEPVTNALSDVEHQFGVQMVKSGEDTNSTKNELIDFGIVLTTTIIPAQEETGTVTDLATEALKRQADAVHVDISSMQSLGDEIKSVTSDMLELGSAKSQAFGVGGSGYVTTSHYEGNRLVIESVPGPALQLKLDEDAARKGADFTANPKGATDSVTLAKQALAEAQALVPVIQSAFEAGNAGVKASDVQSALQAVTAAQTALDKLISGVTAPAASSSGKGASSGGPAVGASDVAAGGGSYPGVVIHQAPGDVLLVAVSTSSGAGGGQATTAADGNTLAAASSAEAASATAAAVSTAADTMYTVVSSLEDLTSRVQQIAGGPGGNLSTSAGPQSGIPRGFTGTWTDGKRYENGVLVNGTVNGVAFVNGVPQYGTAGGLSVGTTSVGNIGQQGHAYLPTDQEYQDAYQQQLYNIATGAIGPVTPVTIPHGSTSGGVQPAMLNITVDQRGANFAGLSAAQVGQATTDALTRTLRDQGAIY